MHKLNEKTDICTNISKHLLDGRAELSRAWGQTAAFFNRLQDFSFTFLKKEKIEKFL